MESLIAMTMMMMMMMIMIVFVCGFHMPREGEGDRLFDALNISSTSKQKRFLASGGPQGQGLGQCQAAAARARKQRPLGGARRLKGPPGRQPPNLTCEYLP